MTKVGGPDGAASGDAHAGRKPAGRRQLRLAIAALAVSVAAAPAAFALDLVPRNLGPATRHEITLGSAYPAGTIVISTDKRTLDFVTGDHAALRYTIGVGRDGFRWSGVVKVGRKEEWPSWRPPAEMKVRAPGLPDIVPPGPYNPLGARGIYLYKDGRDTLYRIHGTNDGSSVGGYVSSGCFRLTNSDVIDLYNRVKVGATVIVK